MCAKSRLKARFKRFFVVFALPLFLLSLFLSLLLPNLKLLQAEYHFFAEVCSLPRDNKDFLSVSDFERRSMIQNLARSFGFHIEFQEILIEYEKNSTTQAMLEKPILQTLGYALPLEFSWLGLFNFSVVSVRRCHKSW